MSTRIYVEVEPELKERLRRHAYAASKTQAEVVQAALEAYLGRSVPREPDKALSLTAGEARDYLAWHLQESLCQMEEDHELRGEAQECLDDLVERAEGSVHAAADFLYALKDIDDSEDIPRWRAARASGTMSPTSGAADTAGRS